jgi:hypothetical protein
LKQAEALRRMQEEVPSPEIEDLVRFIRGSERGICGESRARRGDSA